MSRKKGQVTPSTSKEVLKDILEDVKALTKRKTKVSSAPKKTIKKNNSIVENKVKKKSVSDDNKQKYVIKRKNSDAYLVIDYPIESEVVSGSNYTIRIGASNEGFIEISFNEGEWIPCRFNSGYWWFDWGYFKQGDYKISVRMVDFDGSIILETSPRKCSVC